MQNIHKKYIVILVLLVSSVLCLVGCSDMMAKLGNITLHVVLEDTPKVSVATYKVEGVLANSNVTFVRDDVTSLNVDLSSLKPGKWTISVTAYDADKNQMGTGLQEVTLKEGEVLETSILVTFKQAAPASSLFSTASPVRYDGNEGKIIGTTSEMEYKLASAEDDAYVTCSEEETLLAPGDYMIRYAQQHSFDASTALAITVPAYQPIQLTIGNPTVFTKEYDGTTVASVAVGALLGIQGNDTVLVSALASYDSASAGTNKTITVRYTISGPDIANYVKPVDYIGNNVEITKRQLTISDPSIHTSKVYDGNTSSSVSVGTLSGIISNDSVSVSGLANYASSSAGTGKYLIVSYSLSGDDSSNYKEPVKYVIGNGTISRKELVATATADPKGYDGTTSATGSISLAGIVGTDEVSADGTFTFADASKGINKSVSVTAIHLSGADKDNYTVNASTATTGSIGVTQLTVKASVDSKTYDGTTDATGSLTLLGIIGNDDVSATGTFAFENASASTTSKVVHVTSIQLSGSASAYYTVSATAEATGMINKKYLTATATANQKTYDGTTSATGTISLVGIVGTDDVSATGTFAFFNKKAGVDKAVNVTGIGLTGTTANNYYLIGTPITTNATIDQKSLSATATADLRGYDGTTSATGSISLAGIVGSDEVSADGTFTFADASKGTDKSVSVTAIHLSGADKDNYTVNASTTTTGAIGVTQLTVKASVDPKTYDGTTDATGSLTLLGIEGTDEVSATGTFTFEDAFASTTSKVVHVTSIQLNGTASAYYTVSATAEATGMINKKYLTATATANQKTYDGTTSATGTISLVGIVGTDDVSATGTFAFVDKKAGTDKAVSVTSIQLAGAKSDNYYLVGTPINTSATIGKRQLTIAGTTVSPSKVYDGKTTAEISATGTLSNFISGDTVTAAAYASYASNSVGIGKPVTVNYILSGSDAENYIKPASVTKPATITPATLIAYTPSYSKTYGEANPSFIVSVVGFVNGETVSTASGYVAPTASSTATALSDADSVAITITGGSAVNYSFNTVNTSTLTINKATISGSVSISGIAKYGETLTSDTTNLIYSGTLDYQWNRGGIAISGATGNSYTLVEADIGSRITVTVNGANYISPVTSSSTATVVKADGPAALSANVLAYYPTASYDQNAVNLKNFTVNTIGLEAAVTLDGTNYSEYSNLLVDSRGRAKIKLASITAIKIRIKETTTTYAGSDKLLSVDSQDLSLGDYYQGGIVGYLFTSSDSGYVSGQLHGLLASEINLNSSQGTKWSDDMATTIGTGIAIGTGSANTDKIIDSLGSSASSYAAGFARAYNGGGYSDWFLPSWNELKTLRDNRAFLGAYNTGDLYWSSSESTQYGYSSAINAHAVEFVPSDHDWVYSKDFEALVRAVRNF